jgi:hypothetical protein
VLWLRNGSVTESRKVPTRGPSFRPSGLVVVIAPVSGHVYRFEGKRRPTWRAKYRLPDGRQVKKTIGPARTARGRQGLSLGRLAADGSLGDVAVGASARP